MPSRPTVPTIPSGTKAWDSVLATVHALIFNTPLPLARYTAGTLPDPTLYEHCIVIVSDEDGGTLAVSDGTSWNRVAFA